VHFFAIRDWPDGHFRSPNPMRRKSNFPKRFKLIWVVQCLKQKFSSFFFSEMCDCLGCPGPNKGRIAIVTYVGLEMRWT